MSRRDEVTAADLVESGVWLDRLRAEFNDNIDVDINASIRSFVALAKLRIDLVAQLEGGAPDAEQESTVYPVPANIAELMKALES